MKRNFVKEDFEIKVKATPDKVDIKTKGDNADEFEEFARCILGDNFSYFDAFDDEEDEVEEEDDAEAEVDVEEISDDAEPEDVDDADLFDETEEGEGAPEDINEGILPNVNVDLNAHNFGGNGNNVNVLEEGDVDESLLGGDINLKADLSDFGGSNNDVGVMNMGLKEECNRAFKKWIRGKKLVEGAFNLDDYKADDLDIAADEYEEAQKALRDLEDEDVDYSSSDPLGIKDLYEKRCRWKNCKSEAEQILDEANFSGDADYSVDDNWEDLWDGVEPTEEM